MSRGRKSTAALSVVAPGREPISAPLELGADAVAIWRRIVAVMPSSWFGEEHLDLLAEFCNHAATAASLSNELSRFVENPNWINDSDHGDEGLKRLDTLSRLRQRESHAMVAIGRALRLTKAAQTRPETAYREAKRSGRKPWRDD